MSIHEPEACNNEMNTQAMASMLSFTWEMPDTATCFL